MSPECKKIDDLAAQAGGYFSLPSEDTLHRPGASARSIASGLFRMVSSTAGTSVR